MTSVRSTPVTDFTITRPVTQSATGVLKLHQFAYSGLYIFFGFFPFLLAQVHKITEVQLRKEGRSHLLNAPVWIANEVIHSLAEIHRWQGTDLYALPVASGYAQRFDFFAKSASGLQLIITKTAYLGIGGQHRNIALLYGLFSVARSFHCKCCGLKALAHHGLEKDELAAGGIKMHAFCHATRKLEVLCTAYAQFHILYLIFHCKNLYGQPDLLARTKHPRGRTQHHQRFPNRHFLIG